MLGSSVHEVGCTPTQLGLLSFLERKLNSGQSDQEKVESVKDEDEKEEPEGAVVALRVRLEDEGHLVEVGDPLGQMVQLDLCGEQDHHQAA